MNVGDLTKDYMGKSVDLARYLGIAKRVDSLSNTTIVCRKY